MKALKTIKGRIRPALFAVVLIALAAGLTGCAMTEPLATEHLQQEAKDPRVSIVLLRFKAPRLPPEKIFSAFSTGTIFPGYSLLPMNRQAGISAGLTHSA